MASDEFAPTAPPFPPLGRSTHLLAALLAATAITCLLGWLLKANCTFDGQWPNLELYEKGCYSDALPFWRGKGLAQGAIPYLSAPIEYPVLTGVLIFLEQAATFLLFGPEAGDPDFVLVVSLGNLLLALGITRLLWGLDLPPARLWAWALSPLLILYTGHNWDLLAVSLALAAFVAAERRRLDAAVAFAALGAAAKMFPVVLLPLFALRRLAARRLDLFFELVGIAVLVWAAVNLPVAWLATENWWNFYHFSSERTGTRAALWDLAAHYGLFNSSIPVRNALSALAFAGGMAALIALGWERYRDRLWLLAGPLILWFLLTSKVYSPQFDLWAYPFLLIAARRWWPIALFVVGDVAAYWAELWFFAGEEGGWPAMPMEAIALAALVRTGAAIWLIRDALVLPLPAWLEKRDELPSAEAPAPAG